MHRSADARVSDGVVRGDEPRTGDDEVLLFGSCTYARKAAKMHEFITADKVIACVQAAQVRHIRFAAPKDLLPRNPFANAFKDSHLPLPGITTRILLISACLRL